MKCARKPVKQPLGLITEPDSKVLDLTMNGGCFKVDLSPDFVMNETISGFLVI